VVQIEIESQDFGGIIDLYNDTLILTRTNTDLGGKVGRVAIRWLPLSRQLAQRNRHCAFPSTASRNPWIVYIGVESAALGGKRTEDLRTC
jgi:hypothetical protein